MLSSKFYDELIGVIATFSERKHQVILRRLGFDGKRDSLEIIGKELSVTRERVRQLEVSCLISIRDTCGSTLNSKLKKILNHRKKALYLDDLELEDNWFAGFLNNQLFLIQIIKKLTNYHAFKINGRDVITKINKEQWHNLKLEVLKVLKSQIVIKKPSKNEVKKLISTTAVEFQAEDLSDLLYESIEDKLYFAASKGKGQKVLCSVGKGLASFLTALLFEAVKPLHYTEIAQKCSDIVGHDVKGYVHNNLKGLAYLYGRGIYGTIEHFPLSEADSKRILIAAEGIITQGHPKRQWSCNELNQKLQLPNLPNNLNKYLLNIILTKSKILKSVGRLVWIEKTDQVPRMDLQEAVFLIVKQAGKPISANEIKSFLIKQRGIDKFLTILPTAKMIRVKPNVWGLVERDFLLPKTKRLKILNSLHKNLEERQTGLHITELKQSITKKNMPDNITDYMLLSLTQTDSRFVIRRGQLLGLSVWNDAKRISIREAIEKVAKEISTPVTISNLRKMVEKIVGHEVKQPLNKLLESTNFILDESTKTWFLKA